MSQTKAQLVGGVGISTVSDLSVYGGLNVSGIATATNVSVAQSITATNVSVAQSITATTFYGDGSGLIGVASTDYIITGTAATFNNVVRVGTAITLDATSGVTTTSSLVVSNSIYTSISTTSTNKTLVNRELCTVVPVGLSTIQGLTVTLPASPSSGWEGGVAIAGTFTDTIVGRNSENIMGFSEDLILDKEYSTIRFVYTDTDGGWRIF